jgi:hypothetical protein
MKRISFLPAQFFWALILFNFYALSSWTSPLKILVLVFSLFLLYFTRKASIPYRDTLKNDGEIYLSPVHGVVDSIRTNFSQSDGKSGSHEIRVTVGLWDEKGLYLPTSAEVSHLKAIRGKKMLRGSLADNFHQLNGDYSHTDFEITSKNQAQTLMRFIDCEYEVKPSIWLKSGDRGRGAACFGLYPLGGTLIIYLPQNCDILVFEKERIIPGQTVIAALKESK